MISHIANIIIAYASIFMFLLAFHVTLGTWDLGNPEAFHGGFLVFLSLVSPVHFAVVTGLFILTERIKALRDEKGI